MKLSNQYSVIRVAARVPFSDITNAIKKTLEFVVVDGRWQFEPRTFGLSGIKTISVAGHFHSDKGHFFITAHTVADKPIQSYESATGKIDANSKVEIIASVSVVGEKNARGGVRKLSDRSKNIGGRLNTPYELAQWVKGVIDNYSGLDDGNDNDDETPDLTPAPSHGVLVGV